MRLPDGLLFPPVLLSISPPCCPPVLCACRMASCFLLFYCRSYILARRLLFSCRALATGLPRRGANPPCSSVHFLPPAALLFYCQYPLPAALLFYAPAGWPLVPTVLLSILYISASAFVFVPGACARSAAQGGQILLFYAPAALLFYAPAALPPVSYCSTVNIPRLPPSCSMRLPDGILFLSFYSQSYILACRLLFSCRALAPGLPRRGQILLCSCPYPPPACRPPVLCASRMASCSLLFYCQYPLPAALLFYAPAGWPPVSYCSTVGPIY